MGDNDDGLWEKPAWAKGGVKLKKTGKADAMKQSGTFVTKRSKPKCDSLVSDGFFLFLMIQYFLFYSLTIYDTKKGNLAAPITFTPYKNQDHSNQVANQEKLRATEVGELAKSGEDLAAPITYTPFKNEDHTNYVANPHNLSASEVGEAAREGMDLAAPITFTPYKNEDHSNPVANPDVLQETETGAAAREGENLAMRKFVL